MPEVFSVGSHSIPDDAPPHMGWIVNQKEVALGKGLVYRRTTTSAWLLDAGRDAIRRATGGRVWCSNPDASNFISVYDTTTRRDVMTFSSSSGKMACCGAQCVGGLWLATTRAANEEVLRHAVNAGISTLFEDLEVSALIQADYRSWERAKDLWDGEIVSMAFAPVNDNSSNPLDIFAFVRKGSRVVPNSRAVGKVYAET